MSNVAAILSRKGHYVATASESDTVLDAARTMRDKSIGCVVVLRDSQVVGIFTERDMLYRVVAESKNPAETRVADVMTAPVATCAQATSLKECASMMTSRRMRHIPVLVNEQLIGIVSSGDIIAHKVSNLEETNIFLQEYLHGHQAQAVQA